MRQPSIEPPGVVVCENAGPASATPVARAAAETVRDFMISGSLVEVLTNRRLRRGLVQGQSRRRADLCGGLAYSAVPRSDAGRKLAVLRRRSAGGARNPRAEQCRSL